MMTGGETSDALEIEASGARSETAATLTASARAVRLEACEALQVIRGSPATEGSTPRVLATRGVRKSRCRNYRIRRSCDGDARASRRHHQAEPRVRSSVQE